VGAAVLAGLATFALASAAAAPPPPTRPALVATRDLAAGERLREADLAWSARPDDTLPSDALPHDVVAVGRVLTGAVRAGEALRTRDLVASSLVSSLGPGLVATPVRLADASAAALLGPGDVVDVLAASDAQVGDVGRAEVVASDVRVLVAGVSAATGDAVLGGTTRDGGLLVVATTPQQALDLARAGTTGHLSVTLRPA
jgi:pilus assembly protein CpaB